MKYGATVLDPYQKYNSDKIERVAAASCTVRQKWVIQDTLVFSDIA